MNELIDAATDYTNRQLEMYPDLNPIQTFNAFIEGAIHQEQTNIKKLQDAMLKKLTDTLKQPPTNNN